MKFAFTLILMLSCILLSEESKKIGNYNIEGPYSHRNLKIFIINGPETLKNDNITTLEQAMKDKTLVLHESSQVNKLFIENNSATKTVFIRAGDIVKGGKQDRVLAVDLLIPPNSKKNAINAFCVERSRWQQRGSEKLKVFSSCANAVSGKSLRNAIKGNSSIQQAAVWAQISKEQSKLASNLKTEVRSKLSASSYQLTLENAKLKEKSAKFHLSFKGILDKHPKALGYAFLINNEFRSAEVFGSKALFKAQWHKILNACVTEALADKAEKLKIYDDSWQAMVFGTNKIISEKEQHPSDIVQYTVRESEKCLNYTTLDKRSKNIVHQSWDLKDESYNNIKNTPRQQRARE